MNRDTNPEKENLNFYDILLDEDNKDPIVVRSSSGKILAFEQIFIMMLRSKLYCILKPIEMPGVEEDEAMVFCVNGKGSEAELVFVADEELATEVFSYYYDQVMRMRKRSRNS